MKKEYKKPELKEVELKRRASLLESSGLDVTETTGRLGENMNVPAKMDTDV